MKRTLLILLAVVAICISPATALDLNHVSVDVQENGDVEYAWDYSMSLPETILFMFYDVKGVLRPEIESAMGKSVDDLEAGSGSVRFTVKDYAGIRNGVCTLPGLNLDVIESELRKGIESRGVGILVGVNLNTDATVRFFDGYSVAYSKTHTIPTISHYGSRPLVDTQLEAESLAAITDHMIPVYNPDSYSLQMVNAEWVEKFAQPITLSFLEMSTASNVESIQELVDLTNSVITDQTLGSLLDDAGFIGAMQDGGLIENDEFAAELIELNGLLTAEDEQISALMASGSSRDRAKLEENIREQSDVLAEMKATHGMMLTKRENPTFSILSAGVQGSLSTLIEYAGTITEAEEQHIRNAMAALDSVGTSA